MHDPTHNPIHDASVILSLVVHSLNDMTHPQFLRLMFNTMLGTAKCIEVDIEEQATILAHGYTFDGSSVPGYAEVNNSDLLLRPVVSQPIRQTWDPAALLLPCSVNTIDGTEHASDPRTVLNRLLKKAMDRGLEPRMGCELEFFIVERKDRDEIVPADDGGYFDVPPLDLGLDIRREVIGHLKKLGIDIAAHHHEVANGQHELSFKYCRADHLADSITLARLIISELVRQRSLYATFMPKPFAHCNGSGMHIHQSLWDTETDTNLFSAGESGEISDLAQHYIAGILEHAPALTAIVAPTVNSYKRLTPGFEAPTLVSWGRRNRSVMVRVPHFLSPKAARVEFRCPDPSCSPHLAIAAVLAAGLDGIERELEPPEESTANVFENESAYASLPETLAKALDFLESDTTLRQALGIDMTETLIRLRRKEWDTYIRTAGEFVPSSISKWEILRYLT